MLLQPPVPKAGCKTMCQLQMWQKEAVCLVLNLDHCNCLMPVPRSFFQLQVIPGARLEPLVNEAPLQLKATEAQNEAFRSLGQNTFFGGNLVLEKLSIHIRWRQNPTIFRKQRKPFPQRMLSIRSTARFKFQALSFAFLEKQQTLTEFCPPKSRHAMYCRVSSYFC